MFILPAPVPADAPQLELALPAVPAWFSSLRLQYIGLALALLTTLAILALVRVVRWFRRSPDGIPATLVEKAGKTAENEESDPPVVRRRWLTRLLSWKTSFPSVTVESEPLMELPRSLPPSVRPSAQPVRGQRGRRGPRSNRTKVPLSVICQSKTPASMAKAIMSRHNHRRPPAAPSASSRCSTPSSLARSVSQSSPSSAEDTVS